MTNDEMGASPAGSGSQATPEAPSGLRRAGFDPSRGAAYLAPYPMNTAPEDGTRLLLLVSSGEDDEEICIGGYIDGYDRPGFWMGDDGDRVTPKGWWPLPALSASAIEAAEAAETRSGSVHESAVQGGDGIGTAEVVPFLASSSNPRALRLPETPDNSAVKVNVNTHGDVVFEICNDDYRASIHIDRRHIPRLVEWLGGHAPAPAIEARSDETEGLGPKGESAVGAEGGETPETEGGR